MKSIRFILGVAAGIIISCGVVYALTITARETSYDNSISGSSATNMQDAIDDLYDKAAGGSKSILLWTNPNPSANFAAQTINVDTDYDAFIFVSNFNTTNVSRYYGIIMKNASSGYISAANGYDRLVTVHEDSLTIADCSNYTPYNNILIPYKIYGVKKLELN